MRSFVQKHGKILLAVLGIVLMIVFTMPAIRGQNQQDHAKAEYGRFKNRKITNNDMQVLQGEIGMLEHFGLIVLYDRNMPNWRTPFSQTAVVLNSMAGEDRDKSPYWLLLREEASRYAVSSVSDADIDNLLADRGLSPADIDRDLARMSTNRAYLRYVVSHLDTVESYLRFLLNVPRPVAALEHQADLLLRRIQVSYLTFDGAQGLDRIAEPTTDQVLAQFEAYKDVVATPILPDVEDETLKQAVSEVIGRAQPTQKDLPRVLGFVLARFESDGKAIDLARMRMAVEREIGLPLPPEIGGHHFPFGYKHPDKVAVEYLVLEKARIRALMQPTEDDQRRAYDYYRNNPREFASETPATLSAAAVAAPVAKSWDDVKDMLIEREVDKRVTRTMSHMAERIIAEGAKPWKASQFVEKDQWVDYPTLAQTLGKTSEFRGYVPRHQPPTGLLGSRQLAQLEGIGSAVYRIPAQQTAYPFPVLATHVEELVTLGDRDPLGRMELKVGAEGKPVTDDQGNVYIYRVVDARKSQAATLDEVRPQVVEDCKKRAAYEAGLKAARDADSSGGVKALADKHQLPVHLTGDFSRVSTGSSDIVRHARGFVDAAFSLKTVQEGAAAAPAGDSAITVLENPETLRCYVLEVAKVTRATGEDFAIYRMNLLQQGDEAIQPFLQQYLDRNAMAARLEFKPVSPWARSGQNGEEPGE